MDSFIIQEILEEIPCGIFFQDNTSTINMASHKGVSERSKHINVKFHFVIRLKSFGEVEFPHIKSPEMCADILTKELSDEICSKHAAVMQGFDNDA